MTELLTQLASILDRGVKRRLVVAAAGSVVIALVDGLAIGLVLPLVSTVAGSADGSTSGVVGRALSILGEPGSSELATRLTAVVVTLFIVKDLSSLAFNWWMNGLVNGERAKASAAVMSRILRAPYTLVASRSVADMLRAADTSVAQVYNTAVFSLINATAGAISVVVIILALLAVATLPTLALIAYFSVVALVFNQVAKPAAIRAGESANEAALQAYRTAFAAFGGLKELHLRGTQERFVSRYLDAQTASAAAQRLSSFLLGLPRYVLEIFFILAIGVVVLVGSGGDPGGKTLGVLALYVAAGFRLLPAISLLLGSLTALRYSAGFVSIVYDEFQRTPELTPTSNVPADDRLVLQDKLVVDNVWFRYPDSPTDVLRGVSFDLPRGTSVALVGGSGAGKTTLVDVILGLHTPDRGQITVDDTSIAKQRSAWQSDVAYVAQETFLLDATLAENVAFDFVADQIDRDRVVEALEDAELGELVKDLPDGIDSPVGERGSRLSGGQRQRVGIARALYRDCHMLVLDEATSSLDNETERRVSAAVDRLRGRITLIVIAHRLSTVRNLDNIVYLESGAVTGNGRFDDLAQSHERFSRLVALGSLENPQ